MRNFCINGERTLSAEKIRIRLSELLEGKIPIIICIGTDAVAGDCLGPLAGSMLKQKLLGKTYVFGTVDCPITAKDVSFVANFIKNAYPESAVLAIDAALGGRDEVGKIKVFNSPIKPGLGVNKNLSEIGDVSIIGVVEEKEKGSRFLSSVRLSLVYGQAEIIASAVEGYIKEAVGESFFALPKTANK